MLRSPKSAVLLMYCFLAACNTPAPEIHFKPLSIPAERIDCAVLIKRPPLTPEYKIDWVTVEAAPDKDMAIKLAKLEVKKFLYDLRVREGIVANYILNMEGILFGCSSDAEWMRDYTTKVQE